MPFWTLKLFFLAVISSPVHAGLQRGCMKSSFFLRAENKQTNKQTLTERHIDRCTNTRTSTSCEWSGSSSPEKVGGKIHCPPSAQEYIKIFFLKIIKGLSIANNDKIHIYKSDFIFIMLHEKSLSQWINNYSVTKSVCFPIMTVNSYFIAVCFH